MMKWLYHRILRRMESRYGYDATYLHEIVDAAPAAFRRYMKMQMAGKWAGPLPADAASAASIAGALHEDCGPCVQIATDMALEQGVPAATIRALLSGEPAPADAQLAFDFGRALLSGDPEIDTLRERARTRWGEPGVIALALNAMSARNFP
ncbi:MAG: carboxymuconolactone decarboxylase family protein, partial [Alphaproteobacteria bacterium]|nr:carboxymuconolactone decarboxylase family protein [Alphaproteobacteria bacterium]